MAQTSDILNNDPQALLSQEQLTVKPKRSGFKRYSTFSKIAIFTIFDMSFCHWVIFKLKYLRSQLSVRKVIVFTGKVCLSSFQNTPNFCDSDNSEGSFGCLKLRSGNMQQSK